MAPSQPPLPRSPTTTSKGRDHAITSSPLGLHVGGGKSLFAVAIERGLQMPEVLYFGARSVQDVRAQLVLVARTLPRGSRVVGVAPAVGFTHDERGEDLRIE